MYKMQYVWINRKNVFYVKEEHSNFDKCGQQFYTVNTKVMMAIDYMPFAKRL